MAWTYSDYITLTDRDARKAQLRLHIQEVSDLISTDLSADGRSESTGELRAYLDGLKTELERMEQGAESMTAGGLMRIRRGTR